MQLLEHISMNESQINISVLVRVKQKEEYDRELHLFLVHIGEKEYSTFSVRTIPLNGKGTYAVAISDNDKDLDGVLDAYYFNVD